MLVRQESDFDFESRCYANVQEAHALASLGYYRGLVAVVFPLVGWFPQGEMLSLILSFGKQLGASDLFGMSKIRVRL